MSFPKVVEDASRLTIESCWPALIDQKVALKLPTLEIESLKTFLQKAGELTTTREHKEVILRQASLLMTALYPHLPFKRKLKQDTDPLKALTSVQQMLSKGQLSELQFHTLLLHCFAHVRDDHTAYILPKPFRFAAAFLPFQIRRFADSNGRQRFIVTRVMQTLGNGEFAKQFSFGPGVEILRLGPDPIAKIVNLAAELQPGANLAANQSRAVALLTVRPLGRVAWLFTSGERIMTESDFVFRPLDGGKPRTIRFPWGVATGFAKEPKEFPEGTFSMNETLDCAILASRMLMNRSTFQYEQWAHGKATAGPGAEPESLVSTMPDRFQIQHTGGVLAPGFTRPEELVHKDEPDKRFAHLRVLSFSSGSTSLEAADILSEFSRLLKELNKVAPDGLILDIRGNPGGNIVLAEQMLQALTQKPIAPCRFHFARTPAVLRVLETMSASNVPRRKSLRDLFEPWLGESKRSPDTQDPLTLGHPLTSSKRLQVPDEVYKGPIVLLVDARTYSAADIFAAGFQDHRIGLVAGIDPNTGGGGANVWSHEDLLTNVPDGSVPELEPLPDGVAMSVAIRRARRVGPSEGVDIEDIGVLADLHCPLSGHDLFSSKISAIQRCISFLAGVGKFRIEANVLKISGREVRLSVTSRDIHHLSFTFDRVRHVTRQGSAHPAVITLRWRNDAEPPRQLVIRGFSATGELVAVNTVDLAAHSPAAAAVAAGT